MRFAFIKVEKARFSVSLLCEVLQVSRQGYYAWAGRGPSAKKQDDEHLKQRIQQAFTESDGTYGSPRVQRALAANGKSSGRNRIARIMREERLVGRPPRRRFVTTTDSRHGFRIAPNLLDRNFKPSAPDVVWSTDITYIPTLKGWLYLAVVVDLFSRKVVGWSMRPYIDRRLVLEALEMAITTRRPGPGLLHHSDRGVQYACDEYQRLLAGEDMVVSMSRKGDCWDNAVVESFFSTLKQELVYRRKFSDRDEARTAIFRYIEGFYNRRRLHSTLGYLSPMDYEHLAATTN